MAKKSKAKAKRGASRKVTRKKPDKATPGTKKKSKKSPVSRMPLLPRLPSVDWGAIPDVDDEDDN